MRTLVLALGVGFAVAAAAAGIYWHSRPQTPQVTAQRPADREGALMVDELRSNPGRFQGEIEVQGVVAGTSAGRQLFGLIDVCEAQKCGTTDCAEFILPVKWGGKLPARGETVSVRGQVRTTDKGLMLVAAEVTRQ